MPRPRPRRDVRINVARPAHAGGFAASRWKFWLDRADPWWWYARRLPGWAAFILPPLLFFVPLVLAAFTMPEALPKLAAFQTIVIFVIDVGILTGLASGFTWWVVLAVTMYVEFLYLAWLVRNLEFLRRWPTLDRFLRRREEKALRLYQERDWVRRYHFIGVTVLTFLPLGSGIVAGVFLGKITGMPDRTLVAAVYLGTALWAGFLVLVFGLSIDALMGWVEKVI